MAEVRPGDPRRVAVLGLGAMGLEMATRLAGEFTVTGYDPVSDSRARAEGRGLAWAGTIEAAVAGASVIVVAVRTLEHAEQALLGAGGAVTGTPSGAVVVLTSTVGAPGARQLAAGLAARNVAMLDLPVSGGPRRAGEGDLLVFAGGSDETYDAVRPVVQRLSSRVARAGTAPGDGQSMKAVNQLLCGIHIAAAAEALTLGRALGLDLTALLDTLESGAAGSFMLHDRGPRMIQVLAGETPDVRSRLDIFVKDMGIVLDAGRAGGVAMPVAAAAEQLFRLAENAGYAAQDDSTTALLLHSSSRTE